MLLSTNINGPVDQQHTKHWKLHYIEQSKTPIELADAAHVIKHVKNMHTYETNNPNWIEFTAESLWQMEIQIVYNWKNEFDKG